jgi:outer membrane protein TolC
MNLKPYILLLIIAFPLALRGQQSTVVLTPEKLLWFIKNYHPVSVQSDLLIAKGESTLRKARGAFDPYLYSQIDQKHFNDKNYFSIHNSGLKVPTWFGVEIKTGFDQNNGAFLNPENTVPSGGLWYGGVSVPLGKNLLIDKRRAILQQAKLFSESTGVQQQKLMNDLYFDGMKEYWKWVEVWNQYLVYEEYLELALERFEAVKKSFSFGDIPAIDTLEAFIQVQNRQMNRSQSYLDYQNTTLGLSNFMWFENLTPLVITDSMKPPVVAEIVLNSLISAETFYDLMFLLQESHPEMRLYDFKLADMNVEKRLKAESLKPKININYNVLNEPLGSDVLSGLSFENYKWGLAFSFPLFLREQRGDLQLTRLKIQETELSQQQKLLELENKLKYYFNQQVNLQAQVALYKDAVNNYALLLQGERRKFNSGESSLFLVNSREASLISARIKLIELTSKYKIAQTGLIWATGNLNL